ncbi:acetyl-CoA carboxylase biotin carboxyl carrier protein [Aerophototrophica crusticola]|uniref:Biotin carboxyl carrier protein of acetyl-CoA carboxylase n=1 Tax=Aerophototrophica crusticola TaxID=1709002 RepID=A0A858R6Y3_9PROT|nr:acetyl-CoA carboxylase biotin carboxyl carrier protein [Rhodospirillaceae bacterium B3]
MSSFDLDAEFVRTMAKLLQDSGLTEMEYSEGERRIRLTRAVPQAPTLAYAPMPAAMPAAAQAPAAATPAAPAGNPAQHPGAVKSPMVGTAYLAPEPGAAPFVKAGDTVKAGQTILIIEAMKVMNPIKAPRSGTVTDLLVKDAQPVEYGEALLVIE